MNSIEAYPAGEVNLIDYWRVIWKGKIFIILIVIISSFATAFVSLRMRNIYQAKAVITSILSQTGAGLAQQLGGLAGISLFPPLSLPKSSAC
ncbi:MAG: Wzz/FepE/Etk N-terminal domain-containing protein [Deltaproteobacteria bacterium]|nr:Wzz/FepE/Etk N-terminal domain-containing protein [Deltaproteobacteria bacterium]